MWRGGSSEPFAERSEATPERGSSASAASLRGSTREGEANEGDNYQLRFVRGLC
jgi:hypothetical protein